MAAATNQRQKKMAVGGAVLLVAVLGIQVPRTLKMINKSAAPAAASTTTASATTGVAIAAVPTVSLADATAAAASLQLAPRPKAAGRDVFLHNDAALSGSAMGVPPKSTPIGFVMTRETTTRRPRA